MYKLRKPKKDLYKNTSSGRIEDSFFTYLTLVFP